MELLVALVKRGGSYMLAILGQLTYVAAFCGLVSLILIIPALLKSGDDDAGGGVKVKSDAGRGANLNLGHLGEGPEKQGSSVNIPKQTDILIHRYCNNPLTEGSAGANRRARIVALLNVEDDGGLERRSEEGLETGEYELLSVVVVIRHGDRAAMRPVKQLGQVRCGVDVSRRMSAGVGGLERELLELLSSYEDEVRELGAWRSAKPFSAFTPLPKGVACRPEHMTNVGVLQHLLNGRRLHTVYNEHLQLLSPPALAAGEVVVRCTKFARTYQSTLAFLHTFLPGTNITQTRVQPSPNLRFCDPRLQPCHCPQLDTLHKQLEAENKLRLARHVKITEILEEMRAVVLPGNASRHSPSPLSMFDILMSFVCHGAALPCSGAGRCVRQHELDKLTSFLNMNEKQRVYSHAFLRYSLTTVYPLLLQISRDMAHARAGPKFTLYSGHDVTLSPLIIALGFHDDFLPPYASLVSLELYSHRNGSGGGDFLRVLYNGKDMTRRLRFCKDLLNKDDLCPLGVFTDFVGTGILNFLNATSYPDACKPGRDRDL